MSSLDRFPPGEVQRLLSLHDPRIAEEVWTEDDGTRREWVAPLEMSSDAALETLCEVVDYNTTYTPQRPRVARRRGLRSVGPFLAAGVLLGVVTLCAALRRFWLADDWQDGPGAWLVVLLVVVLMAVVGGLEVAR